MVKNSKIIFLSLIVISIIISIVSNFYFQRNSFLSNDNEQHFYDMRMAYDNKYIPHTGARLVTSGLLVDDIARVPGAGFYSKFLLLFNLSGENYYIARIIDVSIYLLVIRYTNVSISIQGIVGIIVTIILNYIFINKVLSKIKKSEDDKKLENVKQGIKDSYKEFFIRIIPICISIIVLCFANWSTISSFGMVMFWGIALIAIYNYLITATMLKEKAGK